MVEATVDYAMSDHCEDSTASITATSTILPRNDDPLTVTLRSETPLSLDELVHLHQTVPTTRDVPSTLGTLTTTVFSSQEHSSVTKPTSAGTSYVIAEYPGEGKGTAVATYASSLSATNGSASEAEAEQDNNLFGIGDQFESNALRGAARAKKREPVGRSSRPKKLPPIIHYGAPATTSSEEDAGPVIKQMSRRSSKETKSIRHRSLKRMKPIGKPALTDEECISSADRLPPRQFSRTRFHIIIGLCVFIALTFALSAFAAHHTGQGRLACTKGIIFSATVLISICTVLVMTLARRALQEALLAGLLEFTVGFALVIEIHDFMAHAS